MATVGVKELNSLTDSVDITTGRSADLELRVEPWPRRSLQYSDLYTGIRRSLRGAPTPRAESRLQGPTDDRGLGSGTCTSESNSEDGFYHPRTPTTFLSQLRQGTVQAKLLE